MKTKLPLILALCLMPCAFIAAQTNEPPSLKSGLTEIGDAVSSSTNWTLIAGYGRSTTKSRNLAFEDVVYNFNENVGVLVGFDQLWDANSSQHNSVKGGVTLSATIHPFAFLGSTLLTNVIATPFVADALSSEAGNSAGVGNILTTGINFDVWSFKNFEIVSGVQWEKRTGQAHWDADYILFHAGISRRF